MKHSDPLVMIQTYRLLAERCDYPCTSACRRRAAQTCITNSACGIGTLLAEGIGDTIRVSLCRPVEEVKAGIGILESLPCASAAGTW